MAWEPIAPSAKEFWDELTQEAEREKRNTRPNTIVCSRAVADYLRFIQSEPEDGVQ